MSPDSISTALAPNVSPNGPDIGTPSVATPFLSIITRTQGRRPHTLSEVLTCLAAQTDTDFEILIIGHRLDAVTRLVVEEVISDAPAWLRSKIKLILVSEGTRTRPLNAGLAAAQGRYIAVLDDDDAVFAHWVETFHKLARATPGRVLRSVSAQQVVDTVNVAGEQGLRAQGAVNMPYPAKFNFFDHMIENRSPPLSLAFPREVIDANELRFDETLTTTEDWDFTMRLACLVGVTEAPNITSIYRFWDKGESSRTLHDNAEWQANHYRIWDKWNASSFALPPGGVRQLIKLLEEHAAFSAELRRLRHVGLDDAVAAALVTPEPKVVLYGARYELQEIFRSTSWRLTAPLRWIMVLFGAPRPPALAEVELLDAEQAEAYVWQLRQSTSWRITAPIRAVKIWFRRRSLGSQGDWVR
jgi:hypothetical protein